MLVRARLAGWALLILSPCLLRAQEATGSLNRNGAWEIEVWAAEATGKEIGGALGNAQISMAAVRFGRVVHDKAGEGWRRGTLEYTFDAIPVFVTTRPQKVYGGGFAPLGLKWNFDGSRRWHPFVETSGGAIFTPRNVPPGKTDNFNFSATIGPGVMVYTRPGQAVTLSLRFWHLSNAWLGKENPSFNTLQFMVGYSWIK
jgi:hypothetical protein